MLRQRVARTNRINAFRFEGFDFVKSQGGPLHECVYSLLDSFWNGDSTTLMLCGQVVLVPYLKCLVQEVVDRVNRTMYISQPGSKFRLNLTVTQVTERTVVDVLSIDAIELQILSNGTLDPSPAHFDLLCADNLDIAVKRVKWRTTGKAHLVATLRLERLLKSTSNSLVSPRKPTTTFSDGWFPILSELKLIQLATDQGELQKSFTSLCRCLREPGMGFRDSKLTQLLRSSFNSHVRCIVLGKLVTPTTDTAASIKAAKLCINALQALKRARGKAVVPVDPTKNLVLAVPNTSAENSHVPMRKVLESFRNNLKADNDFVPATSMFEEESEPKPTTGVFSLGERIELEGEESDKLEHELQTIKRSFYHQMEQLQSENNCGNSVPFPTRDKPRSKSLNIPTNQRSNSPELKTDCTKTPENPPCITEASYLEKKIGQMEEAVRLQAKEIQELRSNKNATSVNQELLDNYKGRLELAANREGQLKAQVDELVNKIESLRRENREREESTQHLVQELRQSLSSKTKEADDQRDQLLLAEDALLKAREIQISANRRTRENLKMATRLKAELLKERALRITSEGKLEKLAETVHMLKSKIDQENDS